MAYRFHLSIAESLQLRFDNLDLITHLSAAKEQAGSANLAKSSFLANISHELRTPLHGVLSFADLGLKKVTTAPPDKLHSYFHQIKSSGNLLLALLNDLLDLAKLEAGKMDFECRPTDLNLLVATVADEFEARLSERQLTFVRQMPPRPSSVIVDPTRMQQVVRNFLSNAVKFSPAQSAITLRVDHQAASVVFAVHDQGSGIPDGELEAVSV